MIYIPYTVRSPLSYLICILGDVLSVWMNLGNIWHSMFVWLCVPSIKTSARRIMLLDEQPLVVRLGRRTHNGRSYVQKKNIYGSQSCPRLNTRNVYYNPFVRHCGAFYRLKWRNWRAKMCFRPLKETNEKWESNNRTKWAINQNREVITVFVAILLQRLWKVERFIILVCCLSFFSNSVIIIFSRPSIILIVIVTEFLCVGINIFWTLLRAHFNPSLTAQAKMIESGPKHIYTREHKRFYFITRR